MHLAALCGLLLAGQQPSDVLGKATQALDAARYEEAVRLLEPAAQQSPDDIALQFHLGLAYSLAGQDVPAAEAFRKTLKLKPDLYEAQVNLGQLLLRSKQYDEAQTWLAQALAQKPAAERPNYLMGQTLLAQGKPVEAEARFRTIVEAQPKSVDGWLGLGRALSMQKKPAEAAQAFSSALALEPQNPDILLETAALYEASGRRSEAIRLYSQAPASPAIEERLGNLLIQDARPGEAIPHLKAAVEQSPSPANLFALALAYVRDKQPAAATPLLEEILETETANTEIRMFYGRLLRDQRQYGPAVRQFHRVTTQQPDNAEAWTELAAGLVLVEMYPEAVQALEQVRRLKGETAGYHYLRAMSLDHLKQYKPALDSYKRFLEVSENKSPDEEFKARQRIIVIQKVLSK